MSGQKRYTTEPVIVLLHEAAVPLSHGHCIRLRPCRRIHVWSNNVVHDRTHDSEAFKMPIIIDEPAHKTMTILVTRRSRRDDVITYLELFSIRFPHLIEKEMQQNKEIERKF